MKRVIVIIMIFGGVILSGLGLTSMPSMGKEINACVKSGVLFAS